MTEATLNVNLVLDNKTISVPYTALTTVEDVCIYLCKQLGIGTSARHLFALKQPNKAIFLTSPSNIADKANTNVEFRIRFKVANILKLRKIDAKAYDYYFHQVRSDVLENKIAEISYEKHRKELVGLGIADMYRVMLEKDMPRESVENDYKKYIPREVLKRHPFFIKKPIHDTLGKLIKSVNDASFVKAQYIKQLETIAPEYLSESYKAIIDKDGVVSNIIIKISPFHATLPGLRYCLEGKKDSFDQICTIEELGFVSIRNDCTVEICRKNGIPFYLKFSSLSVMMSFISVLDGYYRLTCKWTFNICKDVPTPSLQMLYSMKCHGPVGGEFSYAKLEEKRGNNHGCFIIRESESKYNSYYVDVCMKEGTKPKTFKLERLIGDEFVFNDDLKKYKSIYQLMTAYSDKNGTIYLQECLPPSEYDNSPLLLCQCESVVGDSLTDSSALSIMPSNPVCINWKDLQVYKGQKKEGFRNITMVYRSMWKIAKGKKIEVAMKMLKQESADRYLKDFLFLAGQWAFLQSSTLVRIYGITLTTNISLVLEYFRLGPLDQYLRKNKNIVKPVDLIEASTNLAAALWHLKENDIVHGNIRCRKLMVFAHDENSFNVKLTDPGIHTSYSPSTVHWIPIECYSFLDFAKRSTAADVWAFATTLWEIFMFAEEFNSTDHVQSMRYYASGKRLPQPSNCPSEIYSLMRECWDADPDRRKQPQAIMRDINQILYQVYNSRRTHSYAKVFNKSLSTISTPGVSTDNLYSINTESTSVTNSEDLLINACDVNSELSLSSRNETRSQNWSLNTEELTNGCDFSMLFTNFNFSNTATTSLDSLVSMQSIFELDDDCNVVLQGRIGQGFYGEVYKGTLEYLGDEAIEPRKVAVKKLKSTAMSSCLQDFEREINIMKTLQHPNIVAILGVLRDPEISLVMEYLQHGSLQTYLKIYRESLQINQLLKYALDIAKGMDYLGKKNIVHRDLAARNILVVDENHVKISDFGLAQVLESNDYYILKTNRELPIKWYAPESLRNGKFSVRSDVWSFGVTMCEMFNCGEEPTLTNMLLQDDGQEQQRLLTALEQGERFPAPPLCPQTVYICLIYPCWEADPHHRPMFSKIVKDAEDLLTQY